MSWVFDETKALLNLDKIEKIEVVEIENPEDANTHTVIAYFAPGESQLTAWLTTGSEKHCNEAVEKIAKAVHMVKL